MTLTEHRNGLAAVACTLVLLLATTTARAGVTEPGGASDPGADPAAAPARSLGGPRAPAALGSRTIDLDLHGESARLALADDGAAQESDVEKPKAMDEPKVTVTKGDGNAAAAAPQQTRGDPAKFKFVKEWPFWVIVGGALVAIVATVMLVRNANQDSPCGQNFTAGCFGDR